VENFGMKIGLICFILLYYFPCPFLTLSVHFKPKSVRWSTSFGKRCTGDPINEDAMLVAWGKGDEKYIQNLGQKDLRAETTKVTHR